MTIIHDAFINALLVDSAYVGGLTHGLTGGDLADVLQTRMTPNLAKYIGDNFTVVTQVGGLDSSFDATVWKDNTGKLYVSMRGTQQGADFVVDGDLALTGNARAQVTDMVNWWLRETTPKGQSARQITWTVSPLDSSFAIYQEATPAVGTGNIAAADLGGGIEVNGHSLGGYLASAFTRLFGAQAHVGHTTTFNSAGFAQGSEAVFQQLESVIGLSYGIGRFPSATEQTNYFAKNGINLTTNSLTRGASSVSNILGGPSSAPRTGDPQIVDIWASNYDGDSGIDTVTARSGMWHGASRPIWYEDQPALTWQGDILPSDFGTGHSIVLLQDSLHLMAAMEKLDPNITEDNFAWIFRRASNKNYDTLEKTLDALGKYFGIDTDVPAATTDGQFGDIGLRNKFYEKLKTIQDSGAYQALKDRVQITTPPRDGFAQFGSLQ